MTWPERSFCSTQARAGKAIQTGWPLTSKRMSTASACRVAMATTFAVHRQCRSSWVQWSITWKSSYIITSLEYFVPGRVLHLGHSKRNLKKFKKKDNFPVNLRPIRRHWNDIFEVSRSNEKSGA